MNIAELSEHVTKDAALRRRQRLQPAGGKGDGAAKRSGFRCGSASKSGQESARETRADRQLIKKPSWASGRSRTHASARQETPTAGKVICGRDAIEKSTKRPLEPRATR